MLCLENPFPKLEQTTARAAAPGSRPVDLSSVWTELATGRVRVVGSLCTVTRCYLTLRLADPKRPGMQLQSKNVRLLERVLLGEPQKVLAFESGYSPSTIASCVRTCLSVMGVDCAVQRVPLLLIMAAHAYRGGSRVHDCRISDVQHQGVPHKELSATRPDARLDEALGVEESAVARMWLEGKSYREIARIRNRSLHTVSNQLASACSKLGVSGRVGLLRRLTTSREEVQ